MQTENVNPSSTISFALFIITVPILVAILMAAYITNTSFLSFLALIYFGIFCVFTAKYAPAPFILLLWFIFLRATTMVSGVAIEYGGYMPEMVVSGYPTGAFIRLAIIYTIGIMAGIFILRKTLQYMPEAAETADTLQHSPSMQHIWVYGLFWIILSLCFGAIVIGLQNGFPFLMGMDRILYWKTVSSRFLSFYLGNRMMFVILLGTIFATCSDFRRKGALYLFILIMSISILFAEKFTSICYMLIYFFVPLFLLRPRLLDSINKRIIPLGLMICAITIPAILSAYGVAENPDEAIDRMKTRITSQAELWFMVDMEVEDWLRFDVPRVEHNIRAVVSPDPESVARSYPFLGVRDFMGQYLPSDRYHHYIERGVTLTMATESYLLKMFGWVGMVLPYILLIGIYCLYLAYFAYGVRSGSLIRVLIAGKLLVWSNFGLNQGFFWYVIGLKPLVLIAVILFFEMIVRARDEGS